VGHRVAPDLLVDLLALDHLTGDLGEQLEQFELATGEAEALPAHQGLELVGPDLELGVKHGPGVQADLGTPAAANDRLDPGDDLLGMAGLGDPVVGAEAQAPNRLADGGPVAAHEDAKARGIINPDLDTRAYAIWFHGTMLGRTTTETGSVDDEAWLSVAIPAALAPLRLPEPD
jgi:hypothetical protein